MDKKEFSKYAFFDLHRLTDDSSDTGAVFPRPLSTEAAGLALSKTLFDEKIFYGMKRLHETAGYRYGLFPHETSRKAVDIFFEKAHSLEIRVPATGHTVMTES